MLSGPPRGYLLQHRYLPLQRAGQVCSWKVYFQDESRFGLITVQRRILTAKGVKPIGAFQQKFTYRYVYGVVSPTDGDHFYALATHADTVMFQWFLAQLSAHKPQEFKILFLDRAGYHLAKALQVPENIVLWHLPSYCPELNGIERFWQEPGRRAVKRHSAWHNFVDAQELEQWVEHDRTAEAVESLSKSNHCFFSWISLYLGGY